ncbi:glycosyltransferase [Patescibacteria group bacterium]|nr:glycosyltransferase [Patescibacteria group bacterium]
MRILFIEHPEPDGGSTQLFMGLCQLLGDENVVDFPYKYCLHGQVERLQNEDVKVFMKENPTVFPNGGYSDPYEWLIPSKGREYHYEEIKEMVKNGAFDLVLMTPRLVSTYYFRRLLQDCMSNIPGVIMCDFEDYHDIRFDITATFYPVIKVITKASYLPDNPGVFQQSRKGKERIYPLPLSSPLIDNPAFRFDDNDENKIIDVHARFGLTRSLRKDVVESLRRLKGFQGGIALPVPSTMRIENGEHICGDGGRTVISSLDENVPYMQYLQEIARSNISVSIGGHGLGRNPARQWEIPSYNTLLLCEQQAIFYEHPFEDGKTCVFFNPELKDDVCRKAIYLLDEGNETERKKIAKAGHEHLKKYHTCKARAKRLIEISKEEDMI